MAGYGSFARVMDALEKSIPAEGYIAGPRFSAADVYLGSHIGWGLQFGSIEKRPGFAEYWARVSDRDAYRRATALDDADMPAPASGGRGYCAAFGRLPPLMRSRVARAAERRVGTGGVGTGMSGGA